MRLENLFEKMSKQDQADETIGDVKLSVDEGQLEQLVQDFNLSVVELVGAEKAEKIRNEYEKLFRALKKSRDAEKRLMNKCRDLHAELLKNTSKIASLSDEATAMISLTKENKRAWEMIEEFKRKEQRGEDKLTDFRNQISKLTKMLEACGGFQEDSQRYSYKELMGMKTKLEGELQAEKQTVFELQEKLNEEAENSKQFDGERQDFQAKIMQIQYEVQGKQADLQREQRRRDKLDAELRKAKQDGEEKAEEVKKVTGQLEKAKQDGSQNEHLLKEQKLVVDRNQKEIEFLNEQVAKAQEEYEKVSGRAAKTAEDLAELRTLYKSQEDTVTSLKMEITKGIRTRDTLQRKMHQTEEMKKEAEQQRDMYSAQMASMQKTVEGLKKQIEGGQKDLLKAHRERDMLDTSCRKASNEATKQASIAKQNDQVIRNQDTELANYRNEAQKQRQIIYQLEKDRDRYINEAADLTQKTLRYMEEVKVREAELFDMKKKMAEWETKLKQQQNLYEAVRSDRNLYSKNLIESQDEITEVRRKLSVTHHTIDQLRDEIASRENAMVKERLDKQNIVAERDMLNTELSKLRDQMSQSKTYISQQQRETARLLKIIKESDTTLVLQKKEMESITSERDILGTQLLRRNDELSLLYEKIRIQQSVLDKGERGYRDRIEDIRILKLEIRRIRRELTKTKSVAGKAMELRNDYFHLQRELLAQRAKCKALEEELGTPLNLHRWRRLEGSDPSAFELLKKTHYLQRRLIRKVAMLARAHNVIEEKDRLYLELKRLIARQPGMEAAEKISSYQQALRQRGRQMQAMAGELNMFATQNGENKFEFERITDELASVKKRYLVEKRKNQLHIDKANLMGAATSIERNLSSPTHGVSKHLIVQPRNQRRLPSIMARPRAERFAGGGFKLKDPKPRRPLPVREDGDEQGGNSN